MKASAFEHADDKLNKMRDTDPEYLSLRILIVDDDEEDYFILSEYFNSIKENHYQLTWCPDYAKALQQICSHQFDVIMVDYFLGAKTGLDLLNESIQHGCEEPFIVLTGKGNHELDLKAMQAGAVDYLSKSGIDSENLERCIRYAYERTKFIQALKSSERKFKNIFYRSTDSVFTLDEKFVFSEVNEATTKLLESSYNEIKKLSLFDILAKEYLKEAIVKRLEQSNELQDMEITVRTKSGHVKNGMISLTPEETAEGKYYQGIIHDITQLKKTERANLRTEKRGVTDRLIRMLGHEVRNPLNNINLSLEQILLEEHRPDLAIYFDIIKRNSKRIEDLVTELLQSSKPVEVNPVPNSLLEIVRKSFNEAADRMVLKNIEYQEFFPAEDILIVADADKLSMAFLNIIINAIEAMEGKEGRISALIEKEGEMVQLTIADNGCGISEENMAKLFVPYFTDKRNGMGLGLATTLNILQSHHAEVEVDSAIDKGTSFIITFPVYKPTLST